MLLSCKLAYELLINGHMNIPQAGIRWYRDGHGTAARQLFGRFGA